jgi:protease-4
LAGEDYLTAGLWAIWGEWQMRYRYLGLLILLAPAGCLRPIQTDARITLMNPVTGNVKAELAKDNSGPLVEMPVEGQECGQGPTVAIIDVDGLLLNENMTGPMSAGENPVDLFRSRLDAAAADSRVCAVVVRINSPGGGVTATDIMWRELQKFRRKTQLPVVACIMDLGCGGAYYLATASDMIIAHPTSITGGVGVVLNLYNLQDTLNLFSIVNQSIKSGKNIDMGSVLDALPDETKIMLQRMADELHMRFQDIVRRARPKVDLAKGTTFDGRIFTAAQAQERKLIDRIGYLDDALAAARNLARQPQAKAVLFHRKRDQALTPYAITPNFPLQSTLLPVSIPGVDRSRLPTFLYLWQADPTLQRFSGK